MRLRLKGTLLTTLWEMELPPASRTSMVTFTVCSSVARKREKVRSKKFEGRGKRGKVRRKREELGGKKLEGRVISFL